MLPIIDWPKLIENHLFEILEILSFPKSPEFDPPPGGDPDFRKLVFARGPKTPAKIVSIIDWPNPITNYLFKILEILSVPKSPEIDPPPLGGIQISEN